jgi:hypothetical protein
MRTTTGTGSMAVDDAEIQDSAGLGASQRTGWTGLVADMIVRLSNARRPA